MNILMERPIMNTPKVCFPTFGVYSSDGQKYYLTTLILITSLKLSEVILI